jgi:peptidoglycan/LPS O-acetylase OafA/YrhL
MLQAAATPVPTAASPTGAPRTSSHLRIPSLDGFRAISILLVFIAHVGLDALVPGGLGVTIFFFLSGFLITTLMRAEFANNGHISLRHFWLRRALRIFPPFYLVLLLATLATVLILPPGSFTGAALGVQAIQLSNYWIVFHGYSGQPMGTGVYWSLAVEEHFYLLFPLCYIGMLKLRMSGRQQGAALLTLCALVLLWRCVLVYGYHVPTDRTYMATDTRIDSIMFGCILAVWGNPVLDDIPFDARKWKLLYLPLGCAVLLGTLLFRSDAFRETFRYSIQGLALIPIFIAAIRLPQWLPFRLLNARPMVFLGVLSYSFYLLHLVVIYAIFQSFPKGNLVLEALLAFVISLLLSWASYRFVEKPAARLRKRLTDW